MSGFAVPSARHRSAARAIHFTDRVWTNQRGTLHHRAGSARGTLYNVTDNGMLNAVRAADGEIYYRQQRLPRPYNFKRPQSPPTALYLATEEGDVVIVKLGGSLKCWPNTLTDQFFVASPVIVDGSLACAVPKHSSASGLDNRLDQIAVHVGQAESRPL